MQYNSEQQPLKIAAYARVSGNHSDHQNSIECQLEMIRSNALARGATITREYQDTDHNGLGIDRSGFQQLLEDANSPKPPFDMVVMTDRHRASRNIAEYHDIEDALRKNGITVEYLMEPADPEAFDPISELLTNIDEYSKLRMSADIKSGQHRVLRQGFYLGAQPPFGYRKNTTTVDGRRRSTLEIVPHEAEAISAAFDLAKTGKTPQEIVTELNERNLPAPRGAPWTSKTVRTILKNEIYTGTITWGKNRKDPATFEGVAPVIILREIFMMVQQMIKALVAPKPQPSFATSSPS